jgi:hypothetical protein
MATPDQGHRLNDAPEPRAMHQRHSLSATYTAATGTLNHNTLTRTTTCAFQPLYLALLSQQN